MEIPAAGETRSTWKRVGEEMLRRETLETLEGHRPWTIEAIDNLFKVVMTLVNIFIVTYHLISDIELDSHDLLIDDRHPQQQCENWFNQAN